MTSRHSKATHQSLIVLVITLSVNISLSDEQSQKGMGPRIVNVGGEVAQNTWCVEGGLPTPYLESRRYYCEDNTHLSNSTS